MAYKHINIVVKYAKERIFRMRKSAVSMMMNRDMCVMMMCMYFAVPA